MDIANLRAFVAIAESASFSTAAGNLHLTQPAISKRVAALETSYGARLFDRIGRRVSLTEAGQALLPRAQRILAELDDSRRASVQSQRTGRRRAASGHQPPHRPAPLAADPAYLVTRYPGVELDLHFMDSEAACHAVETAI